MSTATEGPSDDAAGGLGSVEAAVAERCRVMIDQAYAEANRILAEAEQRAAERDERQAQFLQELGHHLTEMSAAYREAMTAARRAVKELSELLYGAPLIPSERSDDSQDAEDH